MSKINNISELKEINNDINSLLEENEKICGKFLALNTGINLMGNYRYYSSEAQVVNNYVNKYLVLTTEKRIIIVFISNNLLKIKTVKSFKYEEINILQIYDMSELTIVTKEKGTFCMLIYGENDISKECLDALDCIITNLDEGKVKIKDFSKAFLYMWIILIIVIAIVFITFTKGNLM